MIKSYKPASIYTDEMKVKIAMDIFTSRERISISCARWGISLATYYNFKNKYIKDGRYLRRVRKRAVNYLF